MRIVLVVFVLCAVFEAALYLLPWPGMRRKLAAFLIVPSLATLAIPVAITSNLWILIVFALGLYRGINLARVAVARMREQQLRRAGLRASLWLIGFQCLTLVAWYLSSTWLILPSTWWFVISLAQVALAIVLFGSTIRNIITTRPPRLLGAHSVDADLPTLTVAIPARNETNDLEACLASVVASDYPKLEILVLDDCSQTRRTPEIIRSYAHAGVRFLQGEMPPEDWLAKNFAYEQLYKAASGSLVLFCGVDVRFKPESLRLLVSVLNAKHKDMISIMPRNRLPGFGLARAVTMVQGMRYAWELSLPRRFFDRPPVLSTCWLIRHNTLLQSGGFAAVRNSIMPERHFTRVSLIHDGYSFMRSSSGMGVSSNKGMHEQHTTAVRVEYPRLRRRLEQVAVLSFVQLVGVIGAFITLIWAVSGLAPQSVLLPSILSVTLLTVTWVMVATITYRRVLVRSLVTLPVAALLDLILLHESMIAYEFFSVVWKERNICIPVMHQALPLPVGRPPEASLEQPYSVH